MQAGRDFATVVFKCLTNKSPRVHLRLSLIYKERDQPFAKRQSTLPTLKSIISSYSSLLESIELLLTCLMKQKGRKLLMEVLKLSTSVSMSRMKSNLL